MDIEKGLDFILGHFETGFPRTISTQKTQNRQVLVYSKVDALKFFEQSNLLDCRISAFSKTEQEQLIPNLVFVDLDDRTTLKETLALFHKTIKGNPTVIDTGNGYAIIQPIKTDPWNTINYNGMTGEELSKVFLSWSERYLTNYKCDSGNHPSLRNSLIRIPGSYNSKINKQVRIVCEWNKKRHHVKSLPFLTHVDKIIKKEKRLQRKQNRNTPNQIFYIEQLLKRKITNGRKRVFALILCPYLVNVKKLPLKECEKIVSSYFEGFIPNSLIRYKLKEVLKKGILPYGLSKMRADDSELYEIVTGQKVKVT